MQLMTLLLCATLQDIDAAYIFDDDDELDANLSALLEVPDLEFLQTENPVVLNSHHIPGQKPAPSLLPALFCTREYCNSCHKGHACLTPPKKGVEARDNIAIEVYCLTSC